MQGYFWLPVQGKIKVCLIRVYNAAPLLCNIVIYAKDEHYRVSTQRDRKRSCQHGTGNHCGNDRLGLFMCLLPLASMRRNNCRWFGWSVPVVWIGQDRCSQNAVCQCANFVNELLLGLSQSTASSHVLGCSIPVDDNIWLLAHDNNNNSRWHTVDLVCCCGRQDSPTLITHIFQWIILLP